MLRLVLRGSVLIALSGRPGGAFVGGVIPEFCRERKAILPVPSGVIVPAGEAEGVAGGGREGGGFNWDKLGPLVSGRMESLPGVTPGTIELICGRRKLGDSPFG